MRLLNDVRKATSMDYALEWQGRFREELERTLPGIVPEEAERVSMELREKHKSQALDMLEKYIAAERFDELGNMGRLPEVAEHYPQWKERRDGLREIIDRPLA